MLNWSIDKKVLELKYTWKISRNQSIQKTNLYIKVSDGKYTGLGEIAPNIRYGESPDSIIQEFNSFLNSSPEKIQHINELLSLCSSLSNSLRFGLESAYLYLKCAKLGITLDQLLDLPKPRPIATTYTLPIMEPDLVPGFIKDYDLSRFSSLKLKVNQENAVELTKILAKHYDKAICIDANEAFLNCEDVLNFQSAIKNIPVLFLEQPLPSSHIENYRYLKKHSTLPIIADESVTDNPDMNDIVSQFHGVNMKLMKAGGFLSGIHILSEAKKKKLYTMIGCMVESSLGIKSALYLAPLCKFHDLDSTFYLKNDPYNLITEQTGNLFFS